VNKTGLGRSFLYLRFFFFGLEKVPTFPSRPFLRTNIGIVSRFSYHVREKRLEKDEVDRCLAIQLLSSFIYRAAEWFYKNKSLQMAGNVVV